MKPLEHLHLLMTWLAAVFAGFGAGNLFSGFYSKAIGLVLLAIFIMLLKISSQIKSH